MSSVAKFDPIAYIHACLFERGNARVQHITVPATLSEPAWHAALAEAGVKVEQNGLEAALSQPVKYLRNARGRFDA